jgi:hypothetical protein
MYARRRGATWLVPFVLGCYLHTLLCFWVSASPTLLELTKLTENNQKLWSMNKGSYLLPQLLQDMKDLRIQDLNVYRGPILSHLGDALMNHNMTEGVDSVHRTAHLWKHTCHRLYTKALSSTNGTWPPPSEPPAEYRRFFTLDDRIPVIPFYINTQHYNGGSGYVWEKKKIDDLVALPDCDCG